MDLLLATTTFETLRLAPPSKLILLEAATLRSAHVPPHPADCPALLTGVDSRELAQQLSIVLAAIYPLEHIVQVVTGGQVSARSITELGTQEDFSTSTCLYIPPLEQGASFESFTEIVAHLRAPNGCPWDREQTHASLRTHLLEEAYETLAAIDSGDFESMCEEFGDLLLQVVLQTQIASEEGQFTIAQVIKNIYDKLVRRHPHVFGDVSVSSVDGVLANWEKLKEKERGEKKEGKGLLDGVPVALPALSQAQEYQDRAARVGFDWPEIEGVLDKISEEIGEVKEAEDPEQLEEELGDLLFALVNLSRWKKVNAESALRETNIKFKRRFRHVEDGAAAQNRSLSDLSLKEMDVLWEEGKKIVG
jgi:tetrapyrrole methylase family protein / MazG family protein